MLSSRSESSQYKWTTAHQQPHQRLRPQHRVRQQHQQTPQQVPTLKRPKWITSSARISFRASSTARREQISGNGQKIQLYLSTPCVDACEILLEWLVMEREHVAEAAIRAKCEEEDWEFDSISTFSRVTFCLPINEDHRNSEKDCNKRQARWWIERLAKTLPGV